MRMLSLQIRLPSSAQRRQLLSPGWAAQKAGAAIAPTYCIGNSRARQLLGAFAAVSIQDTQNEIRELRATQGRE